MAHILHIEDDPANRRLVEKLLVAAGHEVVEAFNGLDGIRLASASRPDLVLVDINIPDLDGYEVTLRLRGLPDFEQVPIIAITAEADRATSLAVGCNGLIAKPIDVREFVADIERFLQGHRELSTEPNGDTKLREQSQKIAQHLESKLIELSNVNRSLEAMAQLRQELLRNVTHELATPLTPIVGYLRLLLNEDCGPLTPMQRKCLLSITESTHRLRWVVDTLVDVNSLETGRMQFFQRSYELLGVVRSALAEISAGAKEKELTVQEKFEDQVFLALGDPDKIRRAVLHVLDNAVKFTPKHGCVAIDLVPNGAHYEVRVADDGPGVASAHMDHIFEPFFQVDGSATRSYSGVGLGLAYTRHVTEAMGGGLSVESPPTHDVAGLRLKGTLVTLRVPRAANTITITDVTDTDALMDTDVLMDADTDVLMDADTTRSLDTGP